MSMSRNTTYRRCTINTVAAAALVGVAYLSAVVYAAVVDAPTHPIYGAAGFLTLGLSLFAGIMVIEDRRAARQKQPASARPAEPATTIEDIDNAPTKRLVIRARVPSPRTRPVPQIYLCDPDMPRGPATIEMAPVVDLGERAAGIFDAGIRVGFDRGFSAAAGFAPPDGPDQAVADAGLN